MKIHPYNWLLPEFPRIPHLIKPTSLQEDDLVLTSEILEYVLSQDLIVEEKLDGANCGMAYDEEGVGQIRNRKHILSKNYFQSKRTPAKEQFLSAWGWQSRNKDKFMYLNKLNRGNIAVYGEWVLAIHGIEYDHLPSQFVAYALYSSLHQQFLPSDEARELLFEAGFDMAREIYKGKSDLTSLKAMASQRSSYSSSDQREGIVIKIPKSINQYKLIRPQYIQNARWNESLMVRQPSWIKIKESAKDNG